MTLFVDASALVAIIRGEPDSEALTAVLEAHDVRLTSGLAVWEATRATASLGHITMMEARAEVERFRVAFAIDFVPIGEAEAAAASAAHDRYGKGRHPATLNMGDCFAYACATTNRTKLLYKGDDFSHTDLA